MIPIPDTEKNLHTRESFDSAFDKQEFVWEIKLDPVSSMSKDV